MIKQPIRLLSISLSFSLLVLLSACTSTRTLDTWTAAQVDPRVGPGQVAVLSLHPRLDLRKAQQRYLTERLRAEGASMASVQAIIPPDVPLNRATRDSLMRTLPSQGIGQVLVLRPVQTETRTTYTSAQNPMLFAGLGVPGLFFSQASIPVSNVQQVTELNLYDTATRQLLWSGQFLTPQNGSAKNVTQDLVDRIVKELKEQGLL